MKINHFDTNRAVLIIAEIGNNHEGNYSLAEEMIHAAAQAGADAVKFQTIIPERLASIKNTKRIEQLKSMQLRYEDFKKLSEVAKKQNVIFLSTPFDIESAKFLESFVPAFKISSGDCDFYPLLRQVAKTGKPVIFSSGLADFDQVKKTKAFIESVWRENHITQDMAVLHCVARYPTPKEEANLDFIKTLQELGIVVGYSDHTLGIEAALLAVKQGVRIIEKHFTLDKNFSEFRDHQLSADPAEFSELVRKIRNKEYPSDNGYFGFPKAFRDQIELHRSIVAARDLKLGSGIRAEDLDWVRPGGGLRPGEENRLIGKILVREILKGETILTQDVK